MKLVEQRKRSIVNRLNYKLETYRKENAIGVNPYETLTQGLNRLGIGYTKTGNISMKGLKGVSLKSLQKLEERTKTFKQYFGERYETKEQINKSVEIEKYLNENKRYIYGAALQNMNEAEYLLENMYSTGMVGVYAIKHLMRCMMQFQKSKKKRARSHRLKCLACRKERG